MGEALQQTPNSLRLVDRDLVLYARPSVRHRHRVSQLGRPSRLCRCHLHSERVRPYVPTAAARTGPPAVGPGSLAEPRQR